eukprot:jgi/Orpsp1_1/1175095/evm.model.c7180000052590.1
MVKYYFSASDLHDWKDSHSYNCDLTIVFGDLFLIGYDMDDTDADCSPSFSQTDFFFLFTIKATKQETTIFYGDRWSDFADNGTDYNQRFVCFID